MPIIAAGAILIGTACDTYTATTDPADLASGWGFPLSHPSSSQTITEINNNATFDNKTITANIDSVAATQPQPDNADAPANNAPLQTAP